MITGGKTPPTCAQASDLVKYLEATGALSNRISGGMDKTENCLKDEATALRQAN